MSQFNVEYDGKFTISYDCGDGTASSFRVTPEFAQHLMASIRQPARAEAGERSFLTSELIHELAIAQVKNAMHLVVALQRDNAYDGANLVALLECFGKTIGDALAAAPCPTPEARELIADLFRNTLLQASNYAASNLPADNAREFIAMWNAAWVKLAAAPCRDTAQEDGKVTQAMVEKAAEAIWRCDPDEEAADFEHFKELYPDAYHDFKRYARAALSSQRTSGEG